MDFDPDGLSIMSTFKHGSRSLAHQTDSLACPRVEWLGVRSSDVSSLLVSSSTSAMSSAQVAAALLTLSVRDRRKAIRMLEGERYMEDGPEIEWRRELQTMLMLGYKAEIELLAQGDGGLQAWLKEKLSGQQAN